MTLDAKVPSGPVQEKWDRAPLRPEAGQPGQQAQVRGHRRRHRPGRRLGRGDAGRARLQRQVLLLPGQPAPRALHRRPGRHQRRQELPERRRQRLPAVLRHGQGRRLPLARGQRLPPGRRSASTSSTSASPRACRSPASTAACWPTAPSAARRSRAPSTPAARPASSCCSAPTRRWRGRSRRGKVRDVTRAPRCSTWSSIDGRARGIVARDLVTGEIESHVGRRGGAGHRRLRQRLLPLDQRQGLQRHGRLARPQARAPASPTPASRRSTRPASRSAGDYQSQAHADERVAAQRRPHLGARRRPGDDARRRTRSPRTSATTTSSARYPSFGNLVPRDIASRARQGGLRRGARRRPRRPRRLPRLRRRDRAAGRATRSSERYGNLFDMYERITGENPYQVPMRIYPAPPLHDGRPVGRLQPDEHRRRACSSSARPTSPTTAPTASGASALMQGLADGYFVLPYTIGDYLARAAEPSASTTDHAGVRRRRGGGRRRASSGCSAIDGKRTVDSFHRELGTHHVGRLRHGAQRDGPDEARSARSRELREEFWQRRPGARQRRRTSTRRSRRPAGSPTSSSSPS